MYKLIGDPGQNTYLLTLQGRILMKLTRISDIPADEKTTMREKAKEIAHAILANELVFLPRGAYIRSSQSLITTAQFLGLVGLLGDETRTSYAEILDQMERWVTSQKESDGSF